MKHAGQGALDELEDLLSKIRGLGHLKEKSRGVFYQKSQAFLHFHEDAEGLFADLRIDGDWQRFAVNSLGERRQLLARVKAVL
jgi:hypothetical protein